MKVGMKRMQRGVCYLIDVVQLEVFEEQHQQRRDGLHNDFFVTVHVNAQLHALKDRDPTAQTHTVTFNSILT